MSQMPVAVKISVGPTITLASGHVFDFLDPHSSRFEIEDIAHGLAHVCRYAGQCRDFYSVAEHSILVSEVVEDYQFEALMHDAAEAFLGDVTRPLKQLLPDFKRIEADVEDAIFERFGLNRDFKEVIKDADLRVLAAEQAQVMAPGTADWAAEAGIVPAEIYVRYLTPREAKARFLERFRELSKNGTA
ncbi:hypothetical protein KEU06_28165 [Pseudaminobacter sp. 19-2017]|uniref:HD family hydrolase n=2 Tax=Pseudaminobacter soli (ex Zhang et al. 2022) TaxID=2831468 RepID=A0A942E7P7_9HYPH|nr:hypothetical protein [Pseudaminobacter soli]